MVPNLGNIKVYDCKNDGMIIQQVVAELRV